ncbi:hypothetical protein J6590_016076 [Homalodisca vitripennis]|nr:hypothetical protein J6590_016076 [Homalodisca vitripennis]
MDWIRPSRSTEIGINVLNGMNPVTNLGVEFWGVCKFHFMQRSRWERAVKLPLCSSIRHTEHAPRRQSASSVAARAGSNTSKTQSVDSHSVVFGLKPDMSPISVTARYKEMLSSRGAR